MYIIDTYKFAKNTKYSCSNSDFVLSKTLCCNNYIVVDDELLDIYYNANNLNVIINSNQNSSCPFCKSKELTYKELESIDENINIENPWFNFFIDDLTVADIKIDNQNERKYSIINLLITNFQGFSWYLRSSLFKDDNAKTITIHGIFSEFSHYFKINFDMMKNDSLSELFECLEDTFIHDDDINNAVCTCFLENISGDGFTKKIEQFLGKNSKEYYNKWDG